MKWQIPAKTFLVGEYIALDGGPALIATTAPYFTVDLRAGASQVDFPVNSPAWNLWQKVEESRHNIAFNDPYNGLGGMGASSAQFLGAFYASRQLLEREVSQAELLEEYLQVAWNGEGIPPSGYDVIAQHLGGCVHIEKNKNIYKSYTWQFADIAFVLVHTQRKLATHEHLRGLRKLGDLAGLSSIAEHALQAFKLSDSAGFIEAINTTYQELLSLNLVAEHTQQMLVELQKGVDILAAKGCGALGADIILLITPVLELNSLVAKLQSADYRVIATSEN